MALAALCARFTELARRTIESDIESVPRPRQRFLPGIIGSGFPRPNWLLFSLALTYDLLESIFVVQAAEPWGLCHAIAHSVSMAIHRIVAWVG
jgi:hypothetical protein